MVITVFLIPIIILLFIKFYRHEISNMKFYLLSGVCLALQTYINCEIFAMILFFGFLSLLLAFLIFLDYKELPRILMSIAIVLIITLILISPFLYLFFLPPKVDSNFFPQATAFVNDLFSPIIPSSSFMLNFQPTQYTLNAVKSNSPGVTFGVAEYNSYFGIPVVIICCLYFYEFKYSKTAKFALLMSIIIFICSLGPILHIWGQPIFWMPWQLMSHVPFFKHALPAFWTFYFIIYCLYHK